MLTRRLRGLGIYLLLLPALLASCAPGPQDWLGGSAGLSQEALQRLYADAVSDASVAEACEISPALVAVTPGNRYLEWRRDGSRMQVLTVTWTSWAGCDGLVGQNTTLAREVWVTAVPELRDAMALDALTLKSRDRKLRLEQMLGLPPGGTKDRFVELWVSPDDLFRPSADPEVSDSVAELTFPTSPAFVAVSAAHRAWYASMVATSYLEGGYPWTRLGYTYDWNPNTDEVGLSEFVIRAGADVGVASVTPTERYVGG